jgi:Skp family chaperone for outer membrane proteins
MNYNYMLGLTLVSAFSLQAAAPAFTSAPVNQTFSSASKPASIAPVSTAKPALTLNCCVYDPQEVMLQSAEWKDLGSQVQADNQKRAAELQKDQESLQAKATEIEGKKSLLAKEALEEEVNAFRRKQRDLQVKVSQMEEDAKMQTQNVEMRFIKKMQDEVEEFRSISNYDLVLAKGMGVHASANATKTDGIIDFMNKRYEDGKKTKKTEASALKLASNDTAKAPSVASKK